MDTPLLLAERIVASASIGLLIGLEREWAQTEKLRYSDGSGTYDARCWHNCAVCHAPIRQKESACSAETSSPFSAFPALGADV